MLLFLAEHNGAPVAAATVAIHGSRAWYMHGALTDDVAHRGIEANRVLLWRCIQWAKSRGAHTFDWRSIPEAPHPGEELYGVYAFKRGFGGAAQRVMPSHDLVLRPAIYWPYLAAVTARHSLYTWRRRQFERERQRPHPSLPSTQRPARPQTERERREALASS
jgi:lipid II:glycine glycyltransferase (peptidoglycan interpeptide bridge formation enzyme)